MPFNISQTDYEPHPEGTFDGTITAVRDLGIRDTQWGPKPKLAIIIRNDDDLRDDGQPWEHFEFCTVTSGEKAKLTLLRQKLLKRPLTLEERAAFDEQVEMVGKKVSYQIEHEYGDNRTFAKIATWALLNDQEPGSDAPQGEKPDADTDDLPF